MSQIDSPAFPYKIKLSNRVYHAKSGKNTSDESNHFYFRIMIWKRVGKRNEVVWLPAGYFGGEGARCRTLDQCFDLLFDYLTDLKPKSDITAFDIIYEAPEGVIQREYSIEYKSQDD